MSHTARLNALEMGASVEDALSFFDALPAVTLDEMLGSWRGSGLHTGHPLDGLLELYGWRGKRFASLEDVHPLLFERPGGRVVSIDPRWVPAALAARPPALAKSRAARAAFRLFGDLLTTRKPRARLRTVEFRGVATAAMIYDARPIIDLFRRVDQDRMLGLMDMRGLPPFFFVLRREQNPAVTYAA